MRAAAFFEPGPPEVLQVVELPDPHPGPDEVRVRVRAAGVQPADVAVRSSGAAPPGTTVAYPQIPGNEFAGVVDEVGSAVTGIVPGDAVLGFRTLGCAAELVTAPAAQVVHKPAEVPWAVAGALSASGQTAHTALQALEVGEGDTVLIHAAAGGVGTVAVQLARLWGATVIGTASERNHAYLRSLGAIPVAYGPGLVERVREVAPQGVSAALDAIGGDALHASLELVKDPERIGTLVDFELADRLGVRKLRTDRRAGRLQELVDLVARGALRITISGEHPLAGAADAHRAVERRHGRGKIVIVPTADDA
ncbi:MAG TPA: NADP-dependent oxidoreductase [Egibacteraceae bacterium]